MVSGPEILSRYVGSAEAKIRQLFAEAEWDQKVELASISKNFNAVELAALVQAAFSRTLFRSIKISTKEEEDEVETFPDIDNVSLTRDDFFDALEPDEVEVDQSDLDASYAKGLSKLAAKLMKVSRESSGTIAAVGSEIEAESELHKGDRIDSVVL
ncbi:uncharacterized protein LOC136030492 isoform X2 [Artemia franciscana]|uniref:Vesicle-fusing ATPase n=1 Tax=Artemia franciscana TaxID=6661 RepID=A0AA88L3E3_ARTSF|nr:hypothetical protein QYM36_016413 [Artemia franciscana]